MKSIRYALLLFVFLIPMNALAQDESESPVIDLMDALAMLRAEVGEDVYIVEAEFEVEDDDGEMLEICWEFEVLDAQGSEMEVEICEDIDSGELVLDVDDENEDSNDDDSDDENEMDDGDEDESSAPSAISLDDALAIVLENQPDSAITGFELEDEDGSFVWEFEFADDSELSIDATTGDILDSVDDSEDDDD